MLDSKKCTVRIVKVSTDNKQLKFYYKKKKKLANLSWRREALAPLILYHMEGWIGLHTVKRGGVCNSERRKNVGGRFMGKLFFSSTLRELPFLLTAKIRHMERFHYRLWRTNKPLLKLFHGWDTPKEPGETKFFPSKNIEKYRNSKEKR